MDIKDAKSLRQAAEKEIRHILEQLQKHTELRIHDVDVEFVDISTVAEKMNLVHAVKITMKI